MDKRIRKIMTINKTLYHRDDVDKLYVSRKDGKRFASIQDSVNAPIRVDSKNFNKWSRE